MSVFFLQFTGRWAFVKRRTDGHIFAVAPRFHEAGSEFCEHIPLMSVNHEQVVFKAAGGVITTRNPTFREAPLTQIRDDRTMTWALNALHVTTNARGASMLTQVQGGVLPDLVELGQRASALSQFDASVVPSSDATTLDARLNAVVELTGALGASIPVVDREVDFRRKGSPTEDSGRPHILPADATEFTVQLPATGTLAFNLGEQRVVVKDGAVVVFSHLCPNIRLHPENPVDDEFGQYYRLLTGFDDASVVPLLPVDVVAGQPTQLAAEGGDCDLQVFAEF